MDACLWIRDTFIDGATFLMPSKVPETSLENYSVDLDNITGVHHVVLRKASLRASLALMKSPKPDYSSHLVEFSNGDMTAVPRVESAAVTHGREVQTVSHREHQRENSITQPEPFRHQDADETSSLKYSLVSPSHKLSLQERVPAPAGTDDSITGIGRIVSQQANEDQSSLCTFSESILHIVHRDIKTKTRLGVEHSDVATQTQEPVTPTVATETSEIFSPSRRSSLGSQDSGTTPSTVPTSPASLTFSIGPIEKPALANSPIDGIENAIDIERTVSPLLGLDLRISRRQLIHLDRIEIGESPSLEEISPEDWSPFDNRWRNHLSGEFQSRSHFST